MGAWGYGIRHDDFVCDLIGEFEDVLKAGKSVAEATAAVTARFGGADGDDIEGPLFWIALADVQWAYGALEPVILERVREDLATGRSLIAWQEDPRALVKRRSALEKFLKKLEVPKARPPRGARTIVRPPPFAPGQCVSIHRFSGDYGAAIVLAAVHTTPECGMNLVGVLGYSSDTIPPIEVFHARQWRILGLDGSGNQRDVGWYLPNGLRKVKPRIAVVGTIEVLGSDPKDSTFYFGWGNFAQALPGRSDSTSADEH